MSGMQSEDQDSKRQRKDRDPLSEVWHKVHEKELSKYLLLLVTTFCCYVAQNSLKEQRKCRQNVGKRTVEKENERKLKKDVRSISDFRSRPECIG